MNKFLQMSTNEILILTELSDLVQLPLIDRNMNETSWNIFIPVVNDFFNEYWWIKGGLRSGNLFALCEVEAMVHEKFNDTLRYAGFYLPFWRRNP